MNEMNEFQINFHGLDELEVNDVLKSKKFEKNCLKCIEELYVTSRKLLDKKYKWRSGGGFFVSNLNDLSQEQIFSTIELYHNPKLKWAEKKVSSLIQSCTFENNSTVFHPDYISRVRASSTMGDMIMNDEEDDDDELGGEEDDDELEGEDDEDDVDQDDDDVDQDEELEDQDEELEDEDENGVDQDEEDLGGDEEEGEMEELEFDHDSELDDEFFHVNEMENFAERLETTEEERELRKKEKESKKKMLKGTLVDDDDESSYEDDDDSIDLDIGNDDEPADYKFEDFFGSKSLIEKSQQKKKLETPAEIRKSRMMEKIHELEEENLGEKEWHMTGEVKSKQRPQNSLLEIGTMDVDVLARQAPVITKEVTETIEELIKRRIRDEDFDDVERRVAPELDADYRPVMELSVTKSKEGLGDIYAREYEEKVLGNASKEEIELSEKHKELHELFTSLNQQLDSLSNYHYTPKPPKPKDSGEITTTKNVAAIQMEEVIPLVNSTASSKAPEELLPKQKGLGKSKEELTAEERRRNRKQKKEIRKKRKAENPAKSKLSGDLLPDNKKKLKLDKTQDKVKWTASGQFFKHLDTVNSIVDGGKAKKEIKAKHSHKL